VSSVTVSFYFPFGANKSDRTEILMIPPESPGYYIFQKHCLHCVPVVRQRKRK